MVEIGLFPLGVVLLPTEQLPLHIFEGRYQELIGECLAGDSEFGLVFADEGWIREVGTRARVVEVLTRFPDGRLNVVVEGAARIRLHELTSGRSFKTGLVSDLGDADESADDASITRALGLFEQLLELTESELELPDARTQQLSYVLAGSVELPASEKLELLGDLSERSRIERVCALLARVLEDTRKVRLAAERAATNGRVDLR